MKKVLSKLLLLTTVLLFGVIFGIYEASQGSLSRPGTESETKEQQEKDHSQKVEHAQKEKEEIQESSAAPQHAPSLESKLEELEKKQLKASEVGEFNFYSELGESIGALFHLFVHSFLSFVMNTIHDLLHS